MKKILLVEDDPDILESLKITLTLKGYQVSTLTDGQGVCEKVRTSRPDLVVMDVMMPAVDGYQACQALKSDERTKMVPVILLSARTQKTEVEMGFSAGADRYLSKPFMNDDLLDTIQSLLSKKK